MAGQIHTNNNNFNEKLAALKEAVEKVKDQRFEDYNSRLNDQTQFFRILLYVVGILFVVTQGSIAFYQINNLNQQKDDIQRMGTALKEEIASQLGKSKPLPKIEVLDADGGILSDQSIVEGTMEIWTATKADRKDVRFPYLYDASGRYKVLRIRYSIKNTGKGIAEKVFAIIYTNDPLIPIKEALYQEKDNTGEEGFDYMSSGLLFDTIFPPNITSPATFNIRLPNDFDPKTHTKLYPVMLKFNYGDELIVTSRFNLRIVQTPRVIPFASDEDDGVRTTIGYGNQSIPKQ